MEGQFKKYGAAPCQNRKAAYFREAGIHQFFTKGDGMKQILWIALSCLFLLTTAHAASFDCAKSTSNTELLICGNTELSKLDDDLDKSYQQALASSKVKPSLTNAQRKWLRDVRNACLNVACLKSVYKLRISELLTRSPTQESELPRSTNQEKLVAFNVGMPGVCGFPGVNFSEDTVVLAAGGLGGRALDFQLDQSGHMATQIDVAVNYPDKPVALMLGASEPTIWNLGWTEGTNIVAVFASGYYSQRVAGLKASTPFLVSSSEDKGPCNTSEVTYSKLGLHDGYVASFEFGNNTNIGKAATEQKLSKILYARRISRIFSVPDGKGAVVIGDPLSFGQQLITSDATPPNSFQDKNAPLAGEAGLSMAMRKGVLRRATLKDAKKWIDALNRKYALQHLPPPDIPPDLDNAYVVLKKFVYPPGLDSTGASFYIPEGVPLPTGEYGSARVYDLNSITLECATSSPCGQAISRGEIGAGSTFVNVFGDSVDKLILDSAHGGRLTGRVVDGKAETISHAPRAVSRSSPRISSSPGIDGCSGPGCPKGLPSPEIPSPTMSQPTH